MAQWVKAMDSSTQSGRFQPRLNQLLFFSNLACCFCLEFVVPRLFILDTKSDLSPVLRKLHYSYMLNLIW